MINDLITRFLLYTGIKLLIANSFGSFPDEQAAQGEIFWCILF